MQHVLPVQDRAAFRAWLCDRADVVVGRGGDDSACPLAVWFHEQTGLLYEVGFGTVAPVRFDMTVQQWPGSTPLEDWASSFQVDLDCTYPLEDVTGAQALRVLDRCAHRVPPSFDALPVGEEYCWAHTPGGWCCPTCARRAGVQAWHWSDRLLAWLTERLPSLVLGLLLGMLLCVQWQWLPIFVVLQVPGLLVAVRL